MAIEVGIWKLGDTPQRVSFSRIESETRLEDILEQDLSVITPGLMLIGRQITTAYGKFIDMLAMSDEGNLVVIELKRNRTPREVVAQLLDYASWIQDLTYEDIAEIYLLKNGVDLEAGYEAHFEASPPEKINQEHELLIVSVELDPSTERIIEYLSTNYGVPINAVFFRYFQDNGSEYLTRSWLVDPVETEAGTRTTKSSRGGKREPWNGQDFYVSFGEGESRNWEDARKYGFISAGGGRWYSQTLYNLQPGHRIFVNIPKVGYVGVGIVTDTAVPAAKFRVNHNGTQVSFLDASHNAHYHRQNSDSDHCEHFVRVDWLKSVPSSEAYWEKGLFAKQHSACKLRNRFTIEKLTEHFELDE